LHSLKSLNMRTLMFFTRQQVIAGFSDLTQSMRMKFEDVQKQMRFLEERKFSKDEARQDIRARSPRPSTMTNDSDMRYTVERAETNHSSLVPEVTVVSHVEGKIAAKDGVQEQKSASSGSGSTCGQPSDTLKSINAHANSQNSAPIGTRSQSPQAGTANRLATVTPLDGRAAIGADAHQDMLLGALRSNIGEVSQLLERLHSSTRNKGTQFHPLDQQCGPGNPCGKAPGRPLELPDEESGKALPSETPRECQK